MTNTQEKIFAVFKDFKTPRNGFLKPQSIDSRSWDRRSQDEFPNAIQELINNRYIETKDSWYVLTDKGYDYIYRDYSIDDTKDLIMNVFKSHNIGVGEILMQNQFISFQKEIDRFHFDSFNMAIQSLIEDDFIDNNDSRFYKLTQLGYDRIY